MSGTLTPVDQWVDDPRAPEDKTPRVVESVRYGLQDAANRTEHLKRIVKDQGVTRIRSVPVWGEGGPNGLNFLAEVTGYADGDVCLVPGYGLYVYDATVIGGQSRPMSVRPDDAALPGLWRLSGSRAVGPNGFASLNALGRVPVQQQEPTNRLIVPGPLDAADGTGIVITTMTTINLSNKTNYPSASRVLVQMMGSSEGPNGGVVWANVVRNGVETLSTPFKFAANSHVGLLHSFVPGSEASVQLSLQMSCISAVHTSRITEGAALTIQVFENV